MRDERSAMYAAPNLLARPAEETARRLALELLDATEAAAARLGDLEDHEALHDFRVALRRLRSTLAAYRPLLGKADSKAVRKRLRRVAKWTSSSSLTKKTKVGGSIPTCVT